VDWTQLRKESLSLKIGQWRLPTEKQREKKEWRAKPEQNIPKLWDSYKR